MTIGRGISHCPCPARFTAALSLSLSLALAACSSGASGNSGASESGGAPGTGGDATSTGGGGAANGGGSGGGTVASGGTSETSGTGGGAASAGQTGSGGAEANDGGGGGPGSGGGATVSDGGPGAGCDGERPGPTNTGVPSGTTLTPSGSIQVITDGAIVEGLDITGTITVLANDVTIRKVRITTGDYYPIRYFDNGNTGLLVEDSEIGSTSGNATSAIAFANYTARRLNIHGSSDGLKADSNVLIEDCWIHDLSNGPGEHNDGVQSTGGKGVTIRHNDISGASNACVQTGDENAATEDLTVECNWLDGGGYTLNIRGTGATRPKNTRVIDNRFGRNAGYGPWTIDDPSPTVTGNAYDDNGEPIPYP